jgi:hypothetical protein
LTTVNRQASFYYKITRPSEVWGNYHTQIAFYDKFNKIIYHRTGHFAHAFQIDNSLEFVKWSNTGDIVIFYEFKRGHVSGDGIYHYVIINLQMGDTYRLDLYKQDHSFFDKLRDYNFKNEEIISKLNEFNIARENCYTDKIKIGPIRWLFGLDKWKPIAKL